MFLAAPPEHRHCERSKQSRALPTGIGQVALDCFVALLLAMTALGEIDRLLAVARNTSLPSDPFPSTNPTPFSFHTTIHESLET
jgi:hypothetical protein